MTLDSYRGLVTIGVLERLQATSSFFAIFRGSRSLCDRMVARLPVTANELMPRVVFTRSD